VDASCSFLKVWMTS